MATIELQNELSEIHLAFDISESKRNYNKDGFFEIKANPIARSGILEYLGKNIIDSDGNVLEGIDPNKMYKVFRSPAQLSASDTLDSFKIKPIIDGHAYLSVSNKDGILPEEKIVHGATGQEVFYDETDGMLKSNLMFFSGHMNKEMEKGKKQISIGATCLYKIQNGVYNGQEYEVVQENIAGNHIAIVNNGRSGALVAVLDQAETNQEAVIEMADNEYKKDDESKDAPMKDEESKKDESKDKSVTLQDCMDAITEIREDVRAMKEAKAAAIADSESEADKKIPAKDESEKESKEDKKDEEKSGAKAMDEKEFLLRNNERENFAKSLADHITIPNKDILTLNEMAQYGVKKLKEMGHTIECAIGDEVTYLKGFLTGKEAPQAVVMAMDKADKPKVEAYDFLSAYKKGEI